MKRPRTLTKIHSDGKRAVISDRTLALRWLERRVRLAEAREERAIPISLPLARALVGEPRAENRAREAAA